ncbi:uncharacterized protein METZ01_LOCUS71862 [marine metagenome]|uniref:Uncharacterized protein n=1 Tax=marine metagenome TaxID=408172 RepID=A0A381TU23_9ZZZZ
MVGQNRDPVRSGPHVALQTGGAQSYGQSEGIEGVLLSMGHPTPMGKEHGLEIGERTG